MVVTHFLSPLRLIFLMAKSHAIVIFVSFWAIASSHHTFVQFWKGTPSGQVQLCRHKAWSASLWRRDTPSSAGGQAWQVDPYFTPTLLCLWALCVVHKIVTVGNSHAHGFLRKCLLNEWVKEEVNRWHLPPSLDSFSLSAMTWPEKWACSCFMQPESPPLPSWSDFSHLMMLLKGFSLPEFPSLWRWLLLCHSLGAEAQWRPKPGSRHRHPIPNCPSQVRSGGCCVDVTHGPGHHSLGL